MFRHCKLHADLCDCLPLAVAVRLNTHMELCMFGFGLTCASCRQAVARCHTWHHFHQRARGKQGILCSTNHRCSVTLIRHGLCAGSASMQSMAAAQAPSMPPTSSADSVRGCASTTKTSPTRSLSTSGVCLTARKNKVGLIQSPLLTLIDTVLLGILHRSTVCAPWGLVFNTFLTTDYNNKASC